MGVNLSYLVRNRNSNSPESVRIKPTAQQRNPKHRSRFASFAFVSSKQFSKLSFKRKRNSKENVKYFRELIDSWSMTDLVALFKEMDTSNIIRLIRKQSDLARPDVFSIGEELFLNELTKDFKLEIENLTIPVHKFFISVRCDSWKPLIMKSSDNSASLSIPQGCSSEDISDFIKYVYDEKWTKSLELLERLKEWAKCHRTVIEDTELLKSHTNQEGDISIFLSNSTANYQGNFLSKNYYEVKCHMAILSARSRVLSNLLKVNRNQIVLEEALFPRAFAPVIIHFLYTDKLDLNLVADGNVSQSSLSEARAIVSGRSPNSALNRAIQLVQIAKFFAIEKLVCLCEDIIVEQLCHDTAVSVLSWALDGGSHFVAKHAQRFVEDEFIKISLSHHLFELPLHTLVTCVSSQFIQATEVEILDAIVKWGEHELLKRMEAREPNVVVDTTHSISRRGIRRSDLCSSELNEILSPLTACIRTDFVLPPFHQSLTSAYRRGIMERAPLKNLICSSSSDINPDIHWFRPDNSVPGPRFYEPYYDELKSRVSVLADVNTLLPASEPMKVQFYNAIPDLIDDNLFQKVKNRILKEIEIVDKMYNISAFPRLFHKKLTIDLISSYVLRQMDIPDDYIEVVVESDNLEQNFGPCDLPDIITEELHRI